ncbi:MAG: hypothetical protein WHX52_22565 [Anaerolineae bacterium]
MNLSTPLSPVTRIMTISTLVAAAALALGYGLNQQFVGSLIFIALGLLWLVGQRYAQTASAGLGLLGFAVGALLGTLYGVQSGWLLVGITAALVAWDLHHFIQHLRINEQRAPDTENSAATATDTETDADTPRLDTRARLEAEARMLEREHLRRLAIVSGLGLLLGALALTVRLTLSFGVIVVLGVVAIFALSRLIRYLRQESD